METYVTGIELKPIGKGKVQFTVTLDPVMRLMKDYEAGEVVSSGHYKFVWLSFGSKTDTPFYSEHGMLFLKEQYGEDYEFYKIRTTEAIAAKNPDPSKPRELHLEIDLEEFYCMQTFSRPVDVVVEAMRTDGNWGYERHYGEGAADINIVLKGQSGTGTADFDTGIVYNKKPVILYAKDASGAEVTTTYINLTDETFATELEMKCYSLDGGTKWKAATSITDKLLASALNKGMTLVIADKFDSKAKKPSDDATLLTFAEINARPKAPKMKINYMAYPNADPKDAATSWQWGFTDGTDILDAETLAKLDVGVAASDKKKVDANGYGSWPAKGGLNVGPLTLAGKQSTTIYFVRTAPVIANDGVTPASKAVKVTAKGLQKAPNIKADYKKEILKAKKDMIIYFGATAPSKLTALPKTAKTYEDYEGKSVVVDKDIAKAGIDVSPYISEFPMTILVWTHATEKKPASAPQTIELAARGDIDAATLTVSKGKLSLDKKYEVYNEEKGKWGSMPKVTESCELKIRLKSTAKVGKTSTTGSAASATAVLAITYGVVDASKGTEGITAAEIVIK